MDPLVATQIFVSLAKLYLDAANRTSTGDMTPEEVATLWAQVQQKNVAAEARWAAAGRT